jgi:vancomycin aglycone glucosyltransferase
MKVSLCAIGSWGDVAPFISLGRALLDRGSDVVLAAPPEFAAAVAMAGLDFQAIAPACRSVVEAASATTDASLSTLPLLLRATRVLTEETFLALPDIAMGSRILVGTGIAYAIPHVAEALGITYRAVSACPRWYPSVHHPPASDRAYSRSKIINSAAWKITKLTTDLALDGTVNRWRRHHGLMHANNLYGRMMGLPGQRVLAADAELAPLPPDVEGTRRVNAIQAFQENSLPKNVEDFLTSGDRPIFVGFGSMCATAADRLLDLVVKSASELHCRIIVPNTWLETRGGSLPKDFLAVGHIAHCRLFPHLAAIVHHGGAGTTTAAARAGLPQVVIPHVMDQHYWGRRVYELGIGPEPLRYRQLSDRSLTSALREILGSPAMTKKAHSLSRRLEGRDGAAELAGILCDDLGQQLQCSRLRTEQRIPYPFARPHPPSHS